MARPHIEFIYSQNLPWQAGLPGNARANIRAKILSLDSDSGEMSTIVKYPAGWQAQRPEALSAEEEMYVLDGEITINGRPYRRDTYACFPAGYVREASSSSQGCVALTFYDSVPNLTTKARDPDAEFVEYLDIYATPWEGKVRDPSLAWMGNRSKVLRWDRKWEQRGTFLYTTPPHTYPENWECPSLT